ncbi:MAG: hypothetical protein CM15mP120_10760 [Pseudomonadota bacterium]|nr:MAG: hypothetical protein CM15mP120_10760 [Pseudomonadota bacterium]
MQEILNRPAKLLTQAQREAYFADGFVEWRGWWTRVGSNA